MERSALTVFSDQSEALNYNFPGFPLYIRRGQLEYFNNYEAENHWHEDIEFLLVTKGEIDYFVNGSITTIKKGQCIFINSKRLHYGFSTTQTKCSFIVLAFGPKLFNSSNHYFSTAWEAKFNDHMDNYLVIDDRTPDGHTILSHIQALMKHIESNSFNPFFTLSTTSQLMYLITKHIEPIHSKNEHEISWSIFSRMVTYIYKHYDQKLQITHIAQAGQVCRSHCFDYFEKYAQTTPLDFLNQYRLKKALELLLNTKRTILEIAISCGFQSNSYFSYFFKKKLGTTPRQYRTQHHDSLSD